MGDIVSCGYRKEPQDELVRAIQQEEQKLGYFDKKIRDLEYAFKKFEVDGRLSRDQLQSALKFAKLQYSNSGEEWSKLQGSQYLETDKFYQFYQNFRIQPDQEVYSSQKLVWTSILLGKGDKQMKAGFIFDNLDAECKDQVKIDQSVEFIKFGVSLTFEYINLFAKDVLLQKLDEIRDKWGNHQDQIINDFLERVHGSHNIQVKPKTVNKKDFVMCFQQKEQEKRENVKVDDWLSTEGIREIFLRKVKAETQLDTSSQESKTKQLEQQEQKENAQNAKGLQQGKEAKV